MEPEHVPGPPELIELADRRRQPSVSVQLSSSPNPANTGAAQIQYKNLVADVERQLAEGDLPKHERVAVVDRLRQLQDDEEFWRSRGARGLAILSTPDELRAFSLTDTVQDRVTVSDRFDLGCLLRDGASRDRAYVLCLMRERDDVRLFSLTRSEPPVEVPLELPDDLDTVLQYAQNHGDADMPRPAGAVGEQPEERRYCRAVQDAVLSRIGDQGHPLVLACSDQLEHAYRAVNTYTHLLAQSAGFNPSNRDPSELAERAWELLDARRDAELSEWRELFGTRRSNGLAASGLKDVSIAATAAAVEELLFDVDAVIEGTIDDLGEVRLGEAAESPVYNIVDEIAARVLRSGGHVRGVRNGDLVDGSPVAAMLRFPIGV